MDELRRSVYLQAMGVTSYVSRSQLPGSALTRRLAIVRSAPDPAPPVDIPRLETVPAVPAPVIASAAPVAQDLPPRFSLVAFNCGGWLWLEELEAALLPEQGLLIQAMAEALGIIPRDTGAASPERVASTQFDWPIHNNQQLDQGREAARSSVTGFVQRKLEQLQCRGLVLLGKGCEARVALEQMDSSGLVHTLGTAEMLRNPLLKKQAWQDLRPLFQRA
jgi:hypothetical protein